MNKGPMILLSSGVTVIVIAGYVFLMNALWMPPDSASWKAGLTIATTLFFIGFPATAASMPWDSYVENRKHEQERERDRKERGY